MMENENQYCPYCGAKLWSEFFHPYSGTNCPFTFEKLSQTLSASIRQAVAEAKQQGFDDAISQMKELTTDSCDPSVQVIHEEIRLLQPSKEKK